MTRINCWIMVLLGLLCSLGFAEAQDGKTTEDHQESLSRINDADVEIEISAKSEESDDLVIKVRFSGDIGDERWISDVVVFWITPTGEGLSLSLRPVTEKLFAISLRGPLTAGFHILHASLTVRDQEGYVQNLYERRYHLEAPSLDLELKEKRNFRPTDLEIHTATENAELESEGDMSLASAEQTDSSGGRGIIKIFFLLIVLLSLGGLFYFFRSPILDVAAMTVHIGGGLIEGAVKMAERRGLMENKIVQKMAPFVKRIGRTFSKTDEASADKSVETLDKSRGGTPEATAGSPGEDLTGQDTVLEYAQGAEDEKEGVVFEDEDGDETSKTSPEDKDQDENSDIDKSLVNRDTEGVVVIGEGDEVGGTDRDTSQTTGAGEASENKIGNDESDSSEPEPDPTGVADDGSNTSDSPESLDREIEDLDAKGEKVEQEVSASGEAEDPDKPSPLQETGT